MESKQTRLRSALAELRATGLHELSDVRSGHSGMSDTYSTVDLVLVEDSPADAELCIRALRKHNLANSLLWVKDGVEALNVLLPSDGMKPTGGNRPKVVLLDLRLPKIDGLEVLRRLRADERTRTMPIVVLTSSKEDREVAASFNGGANSFVAKPVQFDEFVDTVARLGFYWLAINKPQS